MKSTNQSGYTLIEMIVILLVIAVLTSAFASYIMSSMNAYVFIKSRETGLSNCRTSIERMVRELRRIEAPATITIAATTECQFVDTDYNTVDYVQLGTDLLRNSDKLVTSLSSIEGLRFTYYDANLNQTGAPQNIRYIKVKLFLIRGTQGVSMEDGARLRNL